MFDFGSSELLLCAVVALVVIGPKDLPRAMRVVGQWVGRIRGMARHFRSGVDAMIREAELEEDRKSVVSGKSVSVGVALGGGPIITTKTQARTSTKTYHKTG